MSVSIFMTGGKFIFATKTESFSLYLRQVPVTIRNGSGAGCANWTQTITHLIISEDSNCKHHRLLFIHTYWQSVAAICHLVARTVGSVRFFVPSVLSSLVNQADGHILDSAKGTEITMLLFKLLRTTCSYWFLCLPFLSFLSNFRFSDCVSLIKGNVEQPWTNLFKKR